MKPLSQVDFDTGIVKVVDRDHYQGRWHPDVYRDRVVKRIKEDAIGPILRKLLCITGKHQYYLTECDSGVGASKMVVCTHCGLGHKINRRL